MTSEHRTDKTRSLEPIEPTEAARLWKESKLDELADATLELQGYHIEQFVDWLSEEGIDDMRDVSPRTIHSFRLAIKSDLKQNTLSQRISTIRRFLRFCTSIEAVEPHVAERIDLPARDSHGRTETLDEEDAELLLSYLRKFDYASRQHTLIELTWHTGLRTGTLRGLDVADLETKEKRLRIRHRPESDTPLKNQKSAERYVTLTPAIVETLEDYVEHQRPEVEDKFGRKPLFTTKNGRPSVNTLRRWFQAATRPCSFGQGCPHGKEPSECEAANALKEARECPSSVSGHPIRRGSITHHLRRDVPEKVISDRMNVSQDVLDEHYDQRTEDEKAEQRRDYLSNL